MGGGQANHWHIAIMRQQVMFDQENCELKSVKHYWSVILWAQLHNELIYSHFTVELCAARWFTEPVFASQIEGNRNTAPL